MKPMTPELLAALERLEWRRDLEDGCGHAVWLEVREFLDAFRAWQSEPDEIPPEEDEPCPSCGGVGGCHYAVVHPELDRKPKPITTDETPPKEEPVTEPELAPCPFCGDEAAGTWRMPTVFCISCAGCEAEGPIEGDKAETIAYWNRRPPGMSRRLADALEAEPSHEPAPLPDDALERHWIVGAWIRRKGSEPIIVLNESVCYHVEAGTELEKKCIEEAGWSFHEDSPIQTKRDLP